MQKHNSQSKVTYKNVFVCLYGCLSQSLPCQLICILIKFSLLRLQIGERSDDLMFQWDEAMHGTADCGLVFAISDIDAPCTYVA